MIAEERLAGAPILADNSTGYFLPASEDEKAHFIRSMKHRAKEIERAAEAIRLPRRGAEPEFERVEPEFQRLVGDCLTGLEALAAPVGG